SIVINRSGGKLGTHQPCEPNAGLAQFLVPLGQGCARSLRWWQSEIRAHQQEIDSAILKVLERLPPIQRWRPKGWRPGAAGLIIEQNGKIGVWQEERMG